MLPALLTMRLSAPGCSSSIQETSVPQHGYPNVLKVSAARRSCAQIVLDGHLRLFERIPRPRTHVGRPQIMTLLVFAVPGFKRVLYRVPQPSNDDCDAPSHFYVEPNRSNAVFRRMHELPPGSPSFCPHPQVGSIYRTLTNGAHVSPPRSDPAQSDHSQNVSGAWERQLRKPVLPTLRVPGRQPPLHDAG